MHANFQHNAGGFSDGDFPFMILLQPTSLVQWISYGPVPFGGKYKKDGNQRMLALMTKVDVRQEARPEVPETHTKEL